MLWGIKMIKEQETIEKKHGIEIIDASEQTKIKEKLKSFAKSKKNNTDNGLSNVVKEEVFEFLHKEISLKTIAFTNKVLISWSIKEGAEVLLRAAVLCFFCYLMHKQVIFINELIMGIANEGWELNEATLNLFVSVVFIEITTLIGIAIRYLFKERTTNVLDIAKEAINNVNLNNMKYNIEERKEKVVGN